MSSLSVRQRFTPLDNRNYQKAFVGQQLTMNALLENNAALKSEVARLREENAEMRDILQRHGPALIESICKHLLKEISSDKDLEQFLLGQLNSEQAQIVTKAFQQLEETPSSSSSSVVIREDDFDWVVMRPEKSNLELLLKDVETIYKYMKDDKGYETFLEELKQLLPPPEESKGVKAVLKATGKGIVKGAKVSFAVLKFIYRKAFILGQMVSTGTTLAPWALVAVSILGALT